MGRGRLSRTADRGPGAAGGAASLLVQPPARQGQERLAHRVPPTGVAGACADPLRAARPVPAATGPATTTAPVTAPS
ncbi:hypothetical protein [Streptomyces rochei]|uniref:hypothetical protein n=1 Tax=Streptomyces rochei TaxID=1928 RepID=UPI0036910241